MYWSWCQHRDLRNTLVDLLNKNIMQLPQRYRAMRETAIQGHARSSVVVPMDTAHNIDFLLALNSNLSSILNRFWNATRSLHTYTPPVFQVELEKEGWV